MKTKAKIIIAAVLAIAISIGSISVYKYITGPKEPFFTVIHPFS